MKKLELIHSTFPCTCDEMYKRRKLVDPDCFLCNYQEEISDMLTIYANNQINEFVDWCNETRRTAYIPNSFIGKFNIEQNET